MTSRYHRRLRATLIALAFVSAGACVDTRGDSARDARQRSKRMGVVAWLDTAHVLLWRFEVTGNGDVFNATCDSAGLYAVTVEGVSRPWATTRSICHVLLASWDHSIDRALTKIVFTDKDRRVGLHIVHVREGTDAELLTQCTRVRSPAWSPKGDRIAFFGRCPGAPRASGWVVDSGGDNLRPLVLREDSTELSFLTWSPDESAIAFQYGDYPAAPTIRVLTLRTGAVTEVAKGSLPSWSPGGDRVAFEGDSMGIRRLRAISPVGTDRRTILTLDSATTSPVDVPDDFLLEPAKWSPDGRWLAFVSGRAVWVVSADGARLHMLARMR